MDMATPQDKRPTYEQLSKIIRGYEAVDDAIKMYLDGLAAVAWLAHHAHDSTNPGYSDEEYEHCSKDLFRFLFDNINDQSNSFMRSKSLVVEQYLGSARGSDHA